MLKNIYKDNIKISALGLGCMRLPLTEGSKTDINFSEAQKIVDYAYENGINYYDTAYPYHNGQSELFIGEALKKYPRESFYLATKMPIWLVENEADTERIFDEQLKKCQVDYFDFYLCHALDKEKFEKIKKFNIYEFLNKKKNEGKIHNLGFSFHDTPIVLEEICNEYYWDFAQIQLNYIDWELQNSKKQYEILEKNGIPCIVMEPVKGGNLADLCEEANTILKEAEPKMSIASWAIRYAVSLSNIITVLSGMSNMEQLKDNVNTVSNFKPLEKDDYKIIEKAISTYKSIVTVPCTGCKYCIDCPKEIEISNIFSIYNKYALNKNSQEFKASYSNIIENSKAHNCIKCKKCVEHCPQNIDIPLKLDMIEKVKEKIFS